MADALFRRGGQRLPSLLHNSCGMFQRHPFLWDDRAQVAAIKELHHKKHFAVGRLAGVVNPHDSRMVEAREGFELLPELLSEPRLALRLLLKDFDDDGSPVKLLVASQVDDANRTAPKLFFKQVAVFQQSDRRCILLVRSRWLGFRSIRLRQGFLLIARHLLTKRFQRVIPVSRHRDRCFAIDRDSFQ